MAPTGIQAVGNPENLALSTDLGMTTCVLPAKKDSTHGAIKTRRRPDIGYNAPPFASLAQLVERRPYKANVGGSTPSGRTKFRSDEIHRSPKNLATARFFIAQSIQRISEIPTWLMVF